MTRGRSDAVRRLGLIGRRLLLGLRLGLLGLRLLRLGLLGLRLGFALRFFLRLGEFLGDGGAGDDRGFGQGTN